MLTERVVLALAVLCSTTAESSEPGEEGSGEAPPTHGPELRVVELDPKRLQEPAEPSLLRLQLVPLRAEDEFFRGRVALTLWIHEVWNDSRLVRPSRPKDVGPIRLSPEDAAGLSHSPLAVKNALYYKAVATPWEHGRVTLHANGTVESWRKVKVDAPCEVEDRQAAGDAYARSRYRMPAFASFLSRCTLRFGSYLRDRASLRLEWASMAITTHDVPCVGAGGARHLCNLETSTTFKRTEKFDGDRLDELVAQLRFTHPQRTR